MSLGRYSVIISSGSHLPERVVPNKDFLENEFYDANFNRIEKSNELIIQKFQEITGINERRYARDDQNASDIAYLAAKDALESGSIDKESLDYVIVAHNFGDVACDNRRSDFVPSIAARVKQLLGISNPMTVAYDIAFGCPGWLQAVIQANYYLRSGEAKRALVIGAETLSRISDPCDIDCMIYADGAGAVVLEARESETPVGIIAHGSRSDALEYAKLLRMDKSYDPNCGKNDLYLKMFGHKLYKYALQYVPNLIKEVVDKSNLKIEDIAKVLIHQANEKMDEEILKRILELYGVTENVKEKITELMPMTISWLGNSSVATLPTLYDIFSKGNLEAHPPLRGRNIVFASVGAGMNINALVYKLPE
ncbi:MAG: 3-oxoacyl-ACP synthase III family protein [Chloroflexota bacterium]